MCKFKTVTGHGLKQLFPSRPKSCTERIKEEHLRIDWMISVKYSNFHIAFYVVFIEKYFYIFQQKLGTI